MPKIELKNRLNIFAFICYVVFNGNVTKFLKTSGITAEAVNFKPLFLSDDGDFGIFGDITGVAVITNVYYLIVLDGEQEKIFRARRF